MVKALITIKMFKKVDKVLETWGEISIIFTEIDILPNVPGMKCSVSIIRQINGGS